MPLGYSAHAIYSEWGRAIFSHYSQETYCRHNEWGHADSKEDDVCNDEAGAFGAVTQQDYCDAAGHAD